MKLLFKQRFFSWFDSYDIYDEFGNTIFTVEGQLSWGHCLHILDATGYHVATLKEKILTFLPKFELYLGNEDQYLGCIQKELTFFRPRFAIDCNGWQVDGSFWEHNYTVSKNGRPIVSIDKEWMTWGDTYQLSIADDADEIVALAVVITIDCVVESQNN